MKNLRDDLQSHISLVLGRGGNEWIRAQPTSMNALCGLYQDVSIIYRQIRLISGLKSNDFENFDLTTGALQIRSWQWHAAVRRGLLLWGVYFGAGDLGWFGPERGEGHSKPPEIQILIKRAA